MTIRRRDRGLSGDDMGCDGSRVSPDDLLERLRALPGAAPVFEALADVPGVWVVGGAVRDALLGRAPRELDLVVEGDAGGRRPRRLGERRRSSTSASAPPRRGGRGQPRRRAPRALRAPGRAARRRARRRRCARTSRGATSASTRSPSGSPTARSRRSPGALEDLEGGALRVLHERSFLDDPTRLLRLARYAARLGFQIEQETRLWASRRSPAGALGTVTGPRLGAELRLLLREPQPAAMCGLEGLRIGAAAAAGLPASTPTSSSARSA